MLQGKLDKDLIAQPELWRLCIMPQTRSLEIALYPPVAREEIIYRSLPFDAGTSGPGKALEDAIYDNPLLLSDFRHIDCIIDTSKRLILPSHVSDEHYPTLLAQTLPSLSDGDEIMQFPLCDSARLLVGADAGWTGFLRRTFYNIRFHSRLALLTRYFMDRDLGLKTRRMIAIIRDRRLTVIAIDGDRFRLANNFSYDTNADAAYYLLSCSSILGFSDNPDSYDLAIYGESLTTPGSIAETLRDYVPSIRTVPFPTLRYRASKHTLNTPLPLLLLPICE